MKARTKTSIIKHTLRLMLGCTLLAVFISTTGCTGMIVGAIVRAKVTEGTYATVKDTIPPIPTEQGRLFVYVTDRKIALVDSPMAEVSYCSVDRNAYEIYGGSFWWIDLPTGQKKITSEDVMKMKGGLKCTYSYGKYSVSFNLAEGETKYCRVDFRAYHDLLWRYVWKPIMVESSVAETEIQNLSFYIDGGDGVPLDIISE